VCYKPDISFATDSAKEVHCNPSLFLITYDDFVKSPDVALRFILPLDKLRAGYLPLMVSLSNHARLACGSFYGAVECGLLFDFLQVHHILYKIHFPDTGGKYWVSCRRARLPGGLKRQ